MSEKEPTYDPVEIANTVTVSMIVQELGTLLEEHGNEFPFEDREAILARWIEEAGAYILHHAQTDIRDHDNGLTAYQQVVLKEAIINRVCYRALKRIILNRTPELPTSAMSAAVKNFKMEMYEKMMELDIDLNGMKEYLDSEETEECDDDEGCFSMNVEVCP